MRCRGRCPCGSDVDSAVDQNTCRQLRSHLSRCAGDAGGICRADGAGGQTVDRGDLGCQQRTRQGDVLAGQTTDASRLQGRSDLGHRACDLGHGSGVHQCCGVGVDGVQVGCCCNPCTHRHGNRCVGVDAGCADGRGNGCCGARESGHSKGIHHSRGVGVDGVQVGRCRHPCIHRHVNVCGGVDLSRADGRGNGRCRACDLVNQSRIHDSRGVGVDGVQVGGGCNACIQRHVNRCGGVDAGCADGRGNGCCRACDLGHQSRIHHSRGVGVDGVQVGGGCNACIQRHVNRCGGVDVGRADDRGNVRCNTGDFGDQQGINGACTVVCSNGSQVGCGGHTCREGGVEVGGGDEGIVDHGQHVGHRAVDVGDQCGTDRPRAVGCRNGVQVSRGCHTGREGGVEVGSRGDVDIVDHGQHCGHCAVDAGDQRCVDRTCAIACRNGVQVGRVCHTTREGGVEVGGGDVGIVDHSQHVGHRTVDVGDQCGIDHTCAVGCRNGVQVSRVCHTGREGGVEVGSRGDVGFVDHGQHVGHSAVDGGCTSGIHRAGGCSHDVQQHSSRGHASHHGIEVCCQLDFGGNRSGLSQQGAELVGRASDAVDRQCTHQTGGLAVDFDDLCRGCRVLHRCREIARQRDVAGEFAGKQGAELGAVAGDLGDACRSHRGGEGGVNGNQIGCRGSACQRDRDVGRQDDFASGVGRQQRQDLGRAAGDAGDAAQVHIECGVGVDGQQVCSGGCAHDGQNTGTCCAIGNTRAVTHKTGQRGLTGREGQFSAVVDDHAVGDGEGQSGLRQVGIGGNHQAGGVDGEAASAKRSVAVDGEVQHTHTAVVKLPHATGSQVGTDGRVDRAGVACGVEDEGACGRRHRCSGVNHGNHAQVDGTGTVDVDQAQGVAGHTWAGGIAIGTEVDVASGVDGEHFGVGDRSGWACTRDREDARTAVGHSQASDVGIGGVQRCDGGVVGTRDGQRCSGCSNRRVEGDGAHLQVCTL